MLDHGTAVVAAAAAPRKLFTASDYVKGKKKGKKSRDRLMQDEARALKKDLRNIFGCHEKVTRTAKKECNVCNAIFIRPF